MNKLKASWYSSSFVIIVQFDISFQFKIITVIHNKNVTKIVLNLSIILSIHTTHCSDTGL